MNMLWRRRSRSTWPTRCWRAPWKCCSSCTPTTSRTAAPAPCAPWAARAPIRSPARPRRLPRSPAPARRRQRRSAQHAARDRPEREHSGFIEQVKSGKRKLMGFGHRVYKNYDPRARIIKQVAEEVFEVTGRNPKIDIALELERIALSEATSSSANCIPTWTSTRDYLPGDGFHARPVHVLFGIPRTVGWLAQWQEMLGTRSRRSPVRGRSTPAKRAARWCAGAAPQARLAAHA